MLRRFFYSSDGLDLPQNKGVLYVDGAAGAGFSEALDLELSHWVPNRTPAPYKADTSTGICLRFIKAQPISNHSLVVNNHTDVDGILSAFCTCNPDVLQGHESVIEGAARMGDFGAWCGTVSARLCFNLSLLREARQAVGVGSQEIYEECFLRIPEILQGCEKSGKLEVDARLQAFERSLGWVDTGRILRQEIHRRFVVFQISKDLLMENPELKALYQPGFDGKLDPLEVLPRQVRNMWDSQKFQLISVEMIAGTYFDLMIPEYCWAETPDSWGAPGLHRAGGTNALRFDHPRLWTAVQKLSALEKAAGQWQIVENISAFQTLNGRGFPVVVSFIKNDVPAPSSLPSADVADILAGALLEDD